MCQGNGASPAAWTVTSIAMINAQKCKGHGIYLLCPITKRPLHPVGTRFVDDTELVHLNMNKVETVAEAHTALQDSIHNWGHILIATGGALKPSKCFYHLISFSWKPDGSGNTPLTTRGLTKTLWFQQRMDHSQQLNISQ